MSRARKSRSVLREHAAEGRRKPRDCSKRVERQAAHAKYGREAAIEGERIGFTRALKFRRRASYFAGEPDDYLLWCVVELSPKT